MARADPDPGWRRAHARRPARSRRRLGRLRCGCAERRRLCAVVAAAVAPELVRDRAARPTPGRPRRRTAPGSTGARDSRCPARLRRGLGPPPARPRARDRPAALEREGRGRARHGGRGPDLLLRLGDSGSLRRYVPRSGHIVWQRGAHAESRFPPPEDGHVYGLDAASARCDGRPRSASRPTAPRSPAASSGRVTASVGWRPSKPPRAGAS